MNVNSRIIKNCEWCGYEDSIGCVSGLCPSCEEKLKAKNEVVKNE